MRETLSLLRPVFGGRLRMISLAVSRVFSSRHPTQVLYTRTQSRSISSPCVPITRSRSLYTNITQSGKTGNVRLYTTFLGRQVQLGGLKHQYHVQRRHLATAVKAESNSNEQANEHTHMPYMRDILFVLYCGVQTVLLFVTLQENFDLMPATGPSMLPYYNSHGDYWIYDRRNVFDRQPEPGEVLFCKSFTKAGDRILKRVVAVAGDRISCNCIRQNEGFCNGESYHKIPRGMMWLEGDNLADSNDSRYYGPVPQALILGRPIFRIWPPSAMGPAL
ncbi:hypothetical protein SARC_00558 [Sphaeroforma arctica JP610]|uniref:Peptidase S26 domain-containing protein n=1 Tax=Sphaeroforma arctica JP610 TaxID=667725 RepID=A0A0L0GEK4_9EUKA|nr:hypothetical protein SARC_00558 [Sphaeroforma arctica JP610]KNC87316.1 hypothetical protein SARC_00558 [Sphaeroforma arctica JP610]|eukprot:XP_014161218.1 hypothetical protein SARC_00558 [Sphaeroforma arctica JP610]